MGKRFYEARLAKDSDQIIAVLIESLSTCTFGRNVIGCDSDSDIEAPNVFIKASLLLKGLSNNEFAFILGRMELHGEEFHDAVLKIKVNRIKKIRTYPENKAKKWNDPKPITALKNWGFFNSDDYTISDEVFLKYADALLQLRTKNTEEVRFISEDIEADEENSYTLQQIFYGAPGTGKSHNIKDDENVKSSDEKNLVFRTTFHPDSDYSTFVGAYKPTMKAVAEQYKAVAGKDEDITYEFIPQAFLQAYIAAWNNQDENVYLVIEEINRGNCAQIFGDLFQLLDRDDDGFSEYPIMADRDLAKYLINGKDENEKEILTNKDGIKDGKLRLPKNLYIWATMNTSDQSLFPIDSAFKRRWDWVYMPIGYKNSHWEIVIGEKRYNWVDFQHIINDCIYGVDNSEDKQLGDYFVNADRTGFKISADTLLNKILFYIWNDVCKDDPDQIFRWLDDKQEKGIKFSDFFDEDRDKKLQGFMSFHKVLAIGEAANTDDFEDTRDSEETDLDESYDEEGNDVNS